MELNMSRYYFLLHSELVSQQSL